jgi:hypothetical protein
MAAVREIFLALVVLVVAPLFLVAQNPKLDADRDKKMTVYGIFKFENEQLLICSLRGDDGNPSPERPSTFKSGTNNKAELLILKRKPIATE